MAGRQSPWALLVPSTLQRQHCRCRRAARQACYAQLCCQFSCKKVACKCWGHLICSWAVYGQRAASQEAVSAALWRAGRERRRATGSTLLLGVALATLNGVCRQ